MEDEHLTLHTLVPPDLSAATGGGKEWPLISLFAVFDGHGGAEASAYCKAHLHSHLAERVMAALEASESASLATADLARALYEAFIATDEGFACDSWTTKVVGKKRMRTNVTVSGPESLEGCDIGQLITFQVSLDEEFTKKGRAVVKFIVLSADGSDKKVKSLNVKLNRGKAASNSEGKKDRPAKGKKKSESGTADDSDSEGESSSDDDDKSGDSDGSDAS